MKIEQNFSILNQNGNQCINDLLAYYHRDLCTKNLCSVEETCLNLSSHRVKV